MPRTLHKSVNISVLYRRQLCSFSFLFTVNKKDDDGKSVTNLPAVRWSHFFLPHFSAISDLYMTKTKTMRNGLYICSSKCQCNLVWKFERHEYYGIEKNRNLLNLQQWLLPTFDNFKTCSNPKKKKVVKAGINHLSFQTWTSCHPLHLPYF